MKSCGIFLLQNIIAVATYLAKEKNISANGNNSCVHNGFQVAI